MMEIKHLDVVTIALKYVLDGPALEAVQHKLASVVNKIPHRILLHLRTLHPTRIIH